MDRNVLSLDLIGGIYDAAVEPQRWQEVASRFSEALDGAAVCIALDLPSVSGGERCFAASFDLGLAAECSKAIVNATLHAPRSRDRLTRGFAFASPEPTLGNLAVEQPIAHLIANVDGRPIASISAWRKHRASAFSEADLAFANRLVPHLARSYGMVRAQRRMTQQRAALAEVMDRLPAGVFLLNDEGRVVLTSRSAVRILDRRDGVFLSDGGLRAGDARADEILRRHVAAAISPPPDAGRATGGTLAVPRTSDRAPYPVSVSRLLPGCPVRDAVVAVIVMDPETGTEPAVELLRSVHGLTRAEADLVSHLVRGRSLEQAARARGTSVHTVRGHLKQVFSKTGTHRQGELVQLVLRCFVPMGEE